MKNKLAQKNKKDQLKILNVSKPLMNVKHRDQLRKKLKGLLDKQVLSPPEKTGQTKYPKANSSYNRGEEHQSSVNETLKSSKQNDKDKKSNGIPLKQKVKINPKNLKTKKKNEGHQNVQIKSNGSKKKKEKLIIFKDSNVQSNKASHKMQLKEKVQHFQKGTKTSEQYQTSDVNFKTKPQKLVSGKKTMEKLAKSPKTKTEKGEAQKNIGTPKKKSKLSKTKSKPVKSEQYTQGRGPLRPQTSESEFDADLDSSPRVLKRKPNLSIVSESEIDSSPKNAKQKNENTEQALIRAENDFEGSCSSNNHHEKTLFDFLFDGTYNDSEETTSCSDSQNEYTEEEESEFESSDEDTDYEYSNESSENNCDEYTGDKFADDYSSEFEAYFHSSDDDDSYQPPANLLDDIYIAQGAAVKYDLSTDDVGFDSDTQDAQIIEMPAKNKKQKTPTSTIKKSSAVVSKQNQMDESLCSNDEESMMYSDDSCPELVPIENIQDDDSFSSSSCDSSHSCCSSCDCASSEEVFDPEEQYNPMTPEIFKAKAEIIKEMETFFDTTANDPQAEVTTNSFIEEINSAASNPMKFKVYTINNEILNNDSFSSECSKKSVQSSQNGIDTNSENSCSVTKQQKNETPQHVINETAHVNKKAKITPVSPSQFQLPSHKSLEVTEQSNSMNKIDKTTNPSQLKTQIRTLFFNAINCNHVIVLLKEPLYIYGTMKLKLLAGYLEIFGYNPKRNEVLEIFSPRGYSSLKIEPSNSVENVPLNEKEILSLTPFFIRSDLEEILKKFEPTKDAIVILERNDRSKNINMLRKYMVEQLFPNMNSIQSDRPFYTSEFLLRCIITPNTDNVLLINPNWNTIPVQKNSKIMIIGGKSVGKSTLLRYLVNKNLNKSKKILLIDLDIGQPEMFVPQTISATTLTEPLLGPGYFLNKQPDKSFLVGHFSIIHSLEAYIESLKALFEYCNENSDYKDIPWLVNTMGYNKGFGDELISVICSLLHPSNIVQFESDKEVNDFDIIMMKDNVKSIERNIVGKMFEPSVEFDPQHQLTLIRSFIPRHRNYRNDFAMKPRDMRLAMILSRLSSALVGHAEWMTDVKPFCASIDELNIIKMGDDQIGKEDLVKTLVGNLVYLCRMESGKAHECFGIGIVRGVDYPLRQIYLLPTVSADLLASVNCLAICGIPLPSSILLNQGPKVKGSASYVYNTIDDAASMYIMQMYNKPQPFPTGKRRFNVK